MAVESCVAVAPCSTANLGPGYDVFGLALDALKDRVKITKEPGRSTITIKSGDQTIPSVAEFNSAGRVVKSMMRDFGVHDSIKISVTKGVPAGYGIGSSAASAAAAAIAFNALYKLKIDKNKLVEYAAEGEIASAGTKHYDNVSASLLGGFVIGHKGQFIRIEPPRDLFLVVAVPLSMQVPEKKTEVARSVLPKEVPLKSVVHNVSGASTIVAGFALKDVEMIAKGIDDIIVEPARKHLIPGYDAVKQNGLSAGALAVTISGAGPSMIAFLKTRKNAGRVASAMSEGFLEAGVKSRTFACRPSSGARLA
ncbi:MAG: homoserine kinase [Thermoproteota archaeon]